MQKLSTAAGNAVTAAQGAMEQAKAKGTAVSLPARDNPLSVSDFARIEDLLQRDAAIKPITKDKSKPRRDSNGEIYGWEFDLEHVGLEIVPHTDLDHRLIEAIQRPAAPQGAIYHFTRLAAIKRNTRGDAGFQVALEDLAYDLRGRSEWAIMKACEFFRAQPSPFFPDHGEIIVKVDLFDRAAKTLLIEGQKSAA